jgi:hypothetical protein
MEYLLVDKKVDGNYNTLYRVYKVPIERHTVACRKMQD